MKPSRRNLARVAKLKARMSGPAPKVSRYAAKTSAPPPVRPPPKPRVWTGG